MKNKISVSLLSICLLVAFGSCKKTKTTTEDGSYKKALALSEKYGYSSKNGTNLHGNATVGHKTTLTWQRFSDIFQGDCGGAVAGGCFGSVGGPFGILCGAVSGAAFVSASMCGSVFIGGGTPTINAMTNPTAGQPPLSSNPYEIVGRLHNAALQNFIETGTPITTINVSSSFVFDSTYLDSAFTANSITGAMPTYALFAAAVDTFNVYGTAEAMVNGLYAHGRVSQNFHDFWALHYGTLMNLQSMIAPNTTIPVSDQMITLAESYYPQFVTIVNAATDLTAADKKMILICAAVNTYSYVYHMYNQQ